MKRRLLVGSIALFLTGTSAVVTASAGQVFECRDASGKVAYSTVPCGAQAQPASPEAGAPNYETFYGPWHGQTQFRETVAGGGTDALAHLITPLILTIEAGGKVTGATRDSGCRIEGVAHPGPGAAVPSLDLTLSSCQNRLFNRRYTGSLELYARQKYATLQLRSLPPARFGKPATYEISGTLQR